MIRATLAILFLGANLAAAGDIRDAAKSSGGA